MKFHIAMLPAPLSLSNQWPRLRFLFDFYENE
jgi:hypothetical protein